jgi:hypothetical protein
VALEVNIGGDGELFVGEDKVLRLEVLDTDGIPVNILGWAIIFDVRKSDDAVAPAIISATGTVTGSYNVSPTLNGQRALFTLTDDDLNLLTARIYRHSFKRTDAGVETVLAYGDLHPQKATAP